MTYADFSSYVLDELGTDGTRRGIDALRRRSTRNAVIDLQRYIRAYRDGHTTTYQVADLTAKDFAHLGTLPDHAKPKAFYIVSEVPDSDTGDLPDPDCVRNRLENVAWQNRQAMICDERGIRSYQYTVSPFSRQFLVHPLINDETYLLIVWDGLKMTFADVDVVPWPEQAAEAVAAYVKWKILMEVDRRIDLAREWFDPTRNIGIYPSLRLKLGREQRESQDADGKDEEYAVTAVTANSNPVGVGAQDVPFLSLVTTVAGLTSTALAAITTIGITPNYAVSFLNSATLVYETWILKAGTDASDGTSVQRGNDYAAGTNEKVWYKST